MEQLTAPGKCVDCGNDAFIRLASNNGTDQMICGHCYAERLRDRAPAAKKAKPVEPARVRRRL